MKHLKRSRLALWLSGILCFLSVNLYAQLNVGDIAYIGVSSDVTPQQLALVTLAKIPSGTTVYFSDYGWDGSGFAPASVGNTSAEGIITWTTNAEVAAGTILHIQIASGGGITGNLSSMGTVSSSGWLGSAIASGGDNWFVFTGSQASPNFIYGFANWYTGAHGDGVWQTSTAISPVSATTSFLPSTLTAGTSAIALTGPTYHKDNMIYSGSFNGTKAEILANIGNTANWQGNEGNPGDPVYDYNPGGANYPSTFTVVVPPVVSAANISISGATGNSGVYKIGDVVTAVWNNSATGDQNAGVAGVSVNFSQFGGPVSVSASSAADIWTASYTIVAGANSGNNKNVLVTATNSSGSSTTVNDDTNAVLDNAAPAVPPTPTLNAASDSGSSSSDRVTNVVTPVIDGSAEANGTVAVFVDGVQVATRTVNGSGVWTYTSTALTEGAHSVRARAFDAAGNPSIALSATLTIQIDTTAPAAPVSSAPANGSTVYVARPTFSGTATANENISVYLDGSTVLSTTASSTGTWSVANATDLLEGAHTFYARAVDVAGNTSSVGNTNNFLVSTSPTIYTAGGLSAMTTTYGAASVSQAFSVSATNLNANLLVTAPVGFELSLDDSTFGNTVSITPTANMVGNTTVYARLRAVVNAGVYSGDIVLSSTGASNKTVATISSTVNKAALTITAVAQSKVYGTANPIFTASYSGFVNGDGAGSLSTQVTLATTATITTPVGNYTIEASAASGTNYTIAYVNGTLTINPAALTITAAGKTKVYGAVNPTLTANYSGFVAGDTQASLASPVVLATTVTSSTPVGSYAITASGASSPNYTITHVSGNLVVTPASLTITATNQNKVYGASNPTLTAAYSGFVNGDTESSLATPAALTTTATIASSVGSYAITANGASGNNYTITYVNGSLVVTPASLTITAENQTKIYGAANPSLTASYSGFLNGDTPAVLTTPVTLSTTVTTATPIGNYPITASGASAANYNISYISGTLSVTQAVLTITAQNQTKIYGAANPTMTVSYSGFLNGDTEASLINAATLSTTVTTATPVGSYRIVASGASITNYTITYVDGTLAITPAGLTIAVVDQTKVYGASNPAFTASYVGFVNGDTPASLTVAATLTTLATVASPVGSYTITASGGSSPNYNITHVNGVLAVTPASLTIIANNQTKVYGAANPTFTASYSGFQNGDTAASLSAQAVFSTTATVASPVGSYTITASGGASPNYNISHVSGVLSVSPASLTVTANNQTRVYGAVNPTFTVSYSGFQNGDNETLLTSQPTISTTATLTTPVGAYPIVATGVSITNYTISYVNGTLMVTPASLTVTANNQSKVYGSSNPTFTASYVGFVNGDTPASLAAAVTLTTTASAASPVGSYAISASGGLSPNYNITHVNGVLTVTPASLTIAANNQTRLYGAANPTFTASYNGFQNGDTAASLSTQAVFSTTATVASPVGSYTIAVSGGAGPNYNITHVNGVLTVTPASLTITANNQTRVYGAVNPTFTVNYSGFLNGDNQASLTSQPTISSTATLTSPVGTYSISATGAASNNYSISYVTGSLTVTPAPLTVTASNQTKVYGATNPSFTATYAGFLNGDSSTSLNTQPTLSTTATTVASVGTYVITASGASAANYSISYVNGTLSITPAPLTITAENKTKIFSLPNPALTATYTGFVLGDNPTNALSTSPILATSATLTSPQGVYPITVSGAVATNGNYNITYANGTLTITPGVPTSVAIATATVYENRPVGSLAGTLSSTSLDPNATFTYSLVSGAGSADNAKFSISGNQLLSAAAFDYEAQSSFNIRVRTTTQYGLSLEQAFVLTINDVNEAPTMDAVANQTICYTPAVQNLALTGITPGPENAQSVTMTVSTNNPGLFRNLVVTKGNGTNGTLTYSISNGWQGTATVSIVVKDDGGTANSGADTYTRTFNITVNPLPVVTIWSSSGSNSVSKGETINLKADAPGAASYSWATAGGIISGQNTSTLTIRPTQTTTYTVTAFNGTGCGESKQLTIEVRSDFNAVKANNILTPNGDGSNDTWFIANIDQYPNAEVKVIDRSGRLVFSKKGYDNSWNGTYSGAELAQGAYLYVIDFGPGLYKAKGTLTIVRNQ